MKTKINRIYFIMTIIAASVISLTSCNNTDEPTDIIKAEPRYYIETSWSQKQCVNNGNQFAYEAWEHISKAAEDNNGNQFFSPLSLQFALSMLAQGGNEAAAKEIASIYCDGKTEGVLENLNTLCRLLLDELPNVDNTTTVGIANSLWSDNSVSFSPNFEKICKSVFDATSHKFTIGTAKAKNDINKWCSDKTNGLITDFLTENPLSPAIIFNASYFKGRWKYPFNPSNTNKRNFYCENGEKKKVNMMCSEDYSFAGKETKEMFIVTIPYGNGAFSMEIMMPKEGIDFNTCVAKLKSPNYLSNEKILKSGTVKLHLPKFEVSAGYDVTYIIKEMGYHNIIGTYNDILQNGTFNPLIYQKAKCIADENGTEAAAVTEAGIFTGIGSKPTLFEFEINRPFFFTITEQSTGAILFMGKVAQF